MAARRRPRPQHAPAYRRLTASLREMRNQAGLTQRALASKLGMYYTVVHRCETGDRRIDPVEYALWCKVCGCDPGDAIRRVAP